MLHPEMLKTIPQAIRKGIARSVLVMGLENVNGS